VRQSPKQRSAVAVRRRFKQRHTLAATQAVDTLLSAHGFLVPRRPPVSLNRSRSLR
jgi:hypothetical protein